MKVTDQMIYAYAGEPEITATDAHIIEQGLKRVLLLITTAPGTGTRLAELSAWIDEYPANMERDREAALWGRVSKVMEEAGEVTQALIGATDQNPRKGITHSLDDVRKELLDVALTALGAVEHLNGNTGESMVALHEHVTYVHARAGLNGESQ